MKNRFILSSTRMPLGRHVCTVRSCSPGAAQRVKSKLGCCNTSKSDYQNHLGWGLRITHHHLGWAGLRTYGSMLETCLNTTVRQRLQAVQYQVCLEDWCIHSLLSCACPRSPVKTPQEVFWAKSGRYLIGRELGGGGGGGGGGWRELMAFGVIIYCLYRLLAAKMF